MTDREVDPSLPPDTPLPSQDNTFANAGADEPQESAASTSAPASGAGELPDNQQQGNGRPRTRITIYPLPLELRDADAGAADDVPPTEEVSMSGRPRSDESNADDPVDALVELAFPTKSITDWMLKDPLRRWDLFKQAIAKDPAGVDAAVARAREAGYTKSSFTESLQVLVGIRPANAAIADTASITAGRAARRFDSGTLARPFSGPPKSRPLQVPPVGNWPLVRPLKGAGPATRSPGSTDNDFDDDDIEITATFANDSESVGQQGRIVGDDVAERGIVPGQRYAQRITTRNLALTGDTTLDKNTETFLSILEKHAKEWAALRRAANKYGIRANAVFGTLVHREFGEEIEKLKNDGKLRGVFVEQSFHPEWNWKAMNKYMDDMAKYGLEGTIRTDVIKAIKVTGGKKVLAVWDVKTGDAVLRPSRARELAEATGVPLNRVIELNYKSKTALRRHDRGGR